MKAKHLSECGTANRGCAPECPKAMEDMLTDIEESLKEITPAPWIIVGQGRSDFDICGDNCDGTSRPLFEKLRTVAPQDDNPKSDEYTADGRFIVQARDWLPKLARAYRKLLAEVEEMRVLLPDMKLDNEAFQRGVIEGRKEAFEEIKRVAENKQPMPAVVLSLLINVMMKHAKPGG